MTVVETGLSRLIEKLAGHWRKQSAAMAEQWGKCKNSTSVREFIWLACVEAVLFLTEPFALFENNAAVPKPFDQSGA